MKKLTILFTMLITLNTNAAPWMDPGDERLRHHIQILADAGVISTPVTTWPLMWGAVATDLQRSESSTLSLTEAETWSLEYVQFAFKQATQTFRVNAYSGIQSDASAVSHFGTDQREERETKLELDWIGETFAGRLRGTFVNGKASDSFDGEEWRYDGSYLAANIGNWAVSVGSLDRWWGPGWQHSLILSHNARPVDAISVQRNYSDAFDWPVLKWFGPWSVTAFGGVLEKERAIPDAKLLGFRLAFKPLTQLEIGLSRTAQWGGEGRPESLSSLWKVIIGNDNGGESGKDEENNPSNQLGGIDFRIGGRVFNTHSALYGQLIGEDESGALPSRGFYQAGIESAFVSSLMPSVFNRFSLEYANTIADGNRYNVAYEHSTYQSGYRYLQRPLGASIDNDTKAFTFTGQHYLENGDAVTWRYHNLDINVDGTNRGSGLYGGSVYGDGNTQTQIIEFTYAKVFKDVKVSTTINYSTDEWHWNNQTMEGAGFAVALEYRI